MTWHSPFSLLSVLLALASFAIGAEFSSTTSEGRYSKHLQGICTDDKAAIYWSWTDALVKTDSQGRVLKQVPVGNHHGDLCFHNGRVYVAVNFGKFNQPAGKADSWVYVYDGETLAELARHPVPELVHGAGGIAYHAGKFLIVGGLPPGVNENYLYKYDADFRFQKRHVLDSGYTLIGDPDCRVRGWFLVVRLLWAAKDSAACRRAASPDGEMGIRCLARNCAAGKWTLSDWSE